MIIARKCLKLIYSYVYRQCCLVHFAANCSNWKMTFRKPVATTWKMNENQFRQMFLNPWHMLSYIWVHFGLWRPIFTVKIWFSHIFPASAWSPFLSVNLTDKLARLPLPLLSDQVVFFFYDIFHMNWFQLCKNFLQENFDLWIVLYVSGDNHFRFPASIHW